MYTFYLKDKEYQLKTAWDELTSDDFITFTTLLKQFRLGSISLFELKVLFVLYILGINIRRVKYNAMRSQFDENIYHLTRELTFFYRIEYEDKKAFSAISPEIQQQLVKFLPTDLEETPEVRAAARMKKQVIIDAVFGKNLIPRVKKGRIIHIGYSFDITETIVATSLTAQQFIEAQKVMQQLAEKESDQLLNLLCGILYCSGITSPFPKGGQGGFLYTEKDGISSANFFKGVDRIVKEAILLNFSAISNFIVKHTKYAILFNKPANEGKKAARKKHSDGLSDNMYMLLKRGYGNVEDSNLFRFLDMLVKELSDTASDLKNAGKKLAEIAELMNLTIEQVNELI